MPQSRGACSAVWRHVAGKALTDSDRHYREGAAVVETGPGFFRPESRPARDLSVLLAAHQAMHRQKPLRWLDLMAGCGIRSLRWGLEAAPLAAQAPQIVVNDADPDRWPYLQRNFAPLTQSAQPLQISVRAAEAVMAQAYLDQQTFDLIDLDAFGSPGALLQPALRVLAFDGILFLASTDGRSPTGHDRIGAVRNLGSSARVHPASWELALRQQLGLLAREAWLLGCGLEPLFSFSDGRTFRIAVRLRKRPSRDELAQLGLLARCEACGAQQQQSMLRLRGWPSCDCPAGSGRWAIHGPLWLGPLQTTELLRQLMASPVVTGPATKRLLTRLEQDSGALPTVWSTAEIAKRLRLAGPPATAVVVEALQRSGHEAAISGVMAGQIRTDASLTELLQLCRVLGGEAFK